MKPPRLLLLAVFLGGILAAPTRAQLVHLAFTDPRSSLNFKANEVLVPWDLSGGFVSRFDLYYDLGTAVALGDGLYHFTDPARSLWRAQVQHETGLGSFEIVRPLTSLMVWEDYFSFEHLEPEGAWGTLEFSVAFSGSASEPFTLPLPPYQLGYSHLFLHAGSSFFDVPNMGEVYGSASFATATARVVNEVDLHPVPEPSTYAVGALLLLGAAILQAKRSPHAHSEAQGKG